VDKKNIIYLNPDLRLSKNSSDKNIFLSIAISGIVSLGGKQT